MEDKQYFKPNKRGLLRIPAVVLLLVITAFTAFSAGKSEKAPEITTDTYTETLPSVITETTESQAPAIEVRPGSIEDYGGATLKILITHKERHAGFSDDAAPTIISRMQAEEGQMLAFDLNLDIKTVRLADPVAYVNSANAANEGDTADLLVLTVANEAVDLLINGMLSDLGSVSKIDLSAKGFDAGLNEKLSVFGKTYMAAGSATAGINDSLSAIMFDKGKLAGIGEDLYVYMDNGSWTIDTMHAMSKRLSASLNGEEPVRSELDDVVYWWMGSGADDTEHSDTGYKITTSGARSLRLFEQIKNTVYSNYSEDASVGRNNFVFARISVADYAEHETESYGLLPLPKAEEAEKYSGIADPDAATVMSITSFCNEKERSALLATLITERTSEHMEERYLEEICRGDAKSREALKLVLSNRRISVLTAYGFDGEYIGDALKDAFAEYITGKEDDLFELVDRRSFWMQYSMDIILSDLKEITEGK